MNAPPSEPLLLPDGARLVHIGPHKTGTTALQSAFHHNRRALAAQGVHYAGRGQQPAEAAIAVNGGTPLRGEPHAGMEAWTRLVREIHTAETQRVFVSSEFFASADDATIRRIIADIDHPQTHVLVTLRPLWKITPSQWQQYVQNGRGTAFVTWLDRLLDTSPSGRANPSFWHRHRHGALVQRWAEAVGPERVTVVAFDESDRSMLLRAVEQMLGLSEGTLVPHEDRTNRSLTWPEAELVRRVNRRFSRSGWSDETYAALVRHGLVREMKQHPPHAREPRIAVPPSAHPLLEDAARETVRTVATSGVRVVGDLASLATALPDTPGTAANGKQVAPETAAHALLGVVGSSGDVHSSRAPRVADSSLPRLVAALIGRVGDRTRLALTRIRAARHRSPG